MKATKEFVILINRLIPNTIGIFIMSLIIQYIFFRPLEYNSCIFNFVGGLMICTTFDFVALGALSIQSRRHGETPQ